MECDITFEKPVLDGDGRILRDDLTIRPYTLRTLRSLCDLLADKLVLK